MSGIQIPLYQPYPLDTVQVLDTVQHPDTTVSNMETQPSGFYLDDIQPYPDIQPSYIRYPAHWFIEMSPGTVVQPDARNLSSPSQKLEFTKPETWVHQARYPNTCSLLCLAGPLVSQIVEVTNHMFPVFT